MIMSLEKQTVIVLDALRKQRNVADYAAHTVPGSAVDECIKHAESLLFEVKRWLKINKPDLIE